MEPHFKNLATCRITDSALSNQTQRIQNPTRAICPTANYRCKQDSQTCITQRFRSMGTENPETYEQVLAQTLLHRVTTKLNHIFRNLKSKLHQLTIEKNELQTRFEQHLEEKIDPYACEHLLGFDKIEDPGNMIIVTMKNLAPPISIFQYYQAYKPMILKWSSLPYIRYKNHLS